MATSKTKVVVSSKEGEVREEKKKVLRVNAEDKRYVIFSIKTETR